ncbi:pyridoxamine 5'-phosphate oxidase-domain-containing protein [Xylaria sp. FL0064]|nr:pyridoxamine 5'-phosphate oxidase-domain-containing protein [Xylaria sp. FL0064]
MRRNPGAITTASRLARLAKHLQPNHPGQYHHHHHPHHIHHTATQKATMPSPAPPTAAPWRRLFLSHLESMESPEFALSTLRRASAVSHSHSGHNTRDRGGRRPSSILAAPPYFPRVRTCIYRGLWTHLPANPKNDAPLNPEGVWESDLLTFTTDARMEKMEELWDDGFDLDLRSGRRGTDPGSPTTAKVGEELWEEGLARMKGKSPSSEEPPKTTREQKLKGSGGGAAVEAAFWVREHGVQWRVRGRAYVLAPDIESSPEGREVVTLLKSRMRRLASPPDTTGHGEKEKEDREWSFAREITAHFGNLGPVMRGTFRNPPPGRPVSLPVEGEGLKLGQKVTDLEDPIARANFRVVVIVPDELDQADLSDPEHPRRWIHTYVGSSGGKGHGEWETVEVWP